jgi:hypothetical protein
MLADRSTLPARYEKAIVLADLIDAAGIDSATVQAMDAAHWEMLAEAARGKMPSAETRQLVISMLQNREQSRALVRGAQTIPFRIS